MDPDGPVKDIARNVCPRLDFDRFRRVQGAENIAGDDDVRCPYHAAHASRADHEDGSAAVRITGSITEDLALDAQHAVAGNVAVQAQAGSDQGVGAGLRLLVVPVACGQGIHPSGGTGRARGDVAGGRHRNQDTRCIMQPAGPVRGGAGSRHPDAVRTG
jgi:hypothetical protein